MKKSILILAAFAASLAFAPADTVTVQAVAVPPQPVRIAPLVLSSSDAVATIATIKANNNTVSLSGSTVAVYPPSGVLISSGTNAGKINIFLMIRPVVSGTAR